MHSERQNQIISETIRLIHTKGIQGLTIKNISNGIGVTEAAIYRHFKSKDEILSTIINDFRLNIEGETLAIMKSQIPSLEKLRTVLDLLTDTFCSNPSLVSVIFSDEIFKNKKSLYTKISQLINQNAECFRLIAEEGQKNKEVRSDIDANELSIIIMGSYRMVLKNWQLSGQVYSLKFRSNEFFKPLFQIISS